jgi:two-component sensor histidine kinase
MLLLRRRSSALTWRGGWPFGGRACNEQLKYGYAVIERGNVAVEFEQTTSGWRLEVSDEGRGLPEGFDIDQSKGFGIQVVKAFVRRLNAKMAVSSRPGRTSF